MIFCNVARFLSTPSARRATKAFENCKGNCSISIHALREEGDPARPANMAAGRNFYPRPPRGGRPCQDSRRNGSQKFLSTPSARRATSAKTVQDMAEEHFYPRPPRGGRPSIHVRQVGIQHFYPRPPRGGRQGNTAAFSVTSIFLSTPSVRRATGNTAAFSVTSIFLSTPSVRRATSTCRGHWQYRTNFYPRPP